MPFTVTDTKVTRRDVSPRASFRLPRSRRPHVFPELGTVFWFGPCELTGAVTRFSRDVEGADAFVARWSSVPGIDDPSTPPRSTDSAVDEDRLPRSHR